MVKSLVNSYLPEFSDFTRVFSPVRVVCNRSQIDSNFLCCIDFRHFIIFHSLNAHNYFKILIHFNG